MSESHVIARRFRPKTFGQVVGQEPITRTLGNAIKSNTLHHAYLFANRRSNRLKVLIHDGIGVWLCARRLNRGRFIWANTASGLQVWLTSQQLDTLILGLPWQRVGDAISIV